MAGDHAPPAPTPAAPTTGWRRDLARLASAAVLAQLLPLAVLPWLTRVFSAAQIGQWTVFMALASNLAVVACLRFEYAIVLPRREAGARAVLALCLALALGWTVLLTLGVAVVQATGWLDAAGGTGPQRLGGLLWWLPPAVGLAGCVQALTLWHNRRQQLAVVGQARVLAPAVTSGLQALGGVGLAGWPGAAVVAGVWLVAGQVLGVAAGAAWLAWRARKSRPLSRALRWRPGRSLGRRAWALMRRYQQFPLVNAPHAFVNGLQDTLALALVLAWVGPAAAGFFGLMVRVVMAPTSLVGGALSEVLLGRAAACWREGGDLRPLIRHAVWVLAAFALPAAAVLMLAGPWLFATLFGPDWHEAGQWARWLAPCMAGRMIVGPLTILPMILQRQATAFAFSLCGNTLYVLALAAGLWLAPAGSTDLRLACGLVSLALVAYFAVYLAWLWRTVGRRAAP